MSIGLVPACVPHLDWDDGVWKSGVLYRDGGGGHWLLLHPSGHVVGCAGEYSLLIGEYY